MLPIPEQPGNGYSSRFYVQVEDSTMGNLQREYLLHVPTHYKRNNDIPVPLVLDYHGWTGNAGRIQSFNKIKLLFIIIEFRDNIIYRSI